VIQVSSIPSPPISLPNGRKAFLDCSFLPPLSPSLPQLLQPLEVLAGCCITEDGSPAAEEGARTFPDLKEGGIEGGREGGVEDKEGRRRRREGMKGGREKVVALSALVFMRIGPFFDLRK